MREMFKEIHGNTLFCYLIFLTFLTIHTFQKSCRQVESEITNLNNFKQILCRSTN